MRDEWDKWLKFNRKYKMTPEDWADWRYNRADYKRYRCKKCGAFISALAAFLIAKGKVSCCAA